MKHLFPLFFLLASCGASHKLKTSSHKSTDSVVTTHQDTARVVHEKSSSSNLQAKDVHIEVTYPAEGKSLSPADTAMRQAIQRPADRAPIKSTGNKVVDAIRDAIASAGSSGRIPSSIKIDIGSISDSSARNVRKDSGSGSKITTADIHKVDDNRSKEVTREGMPAIVRISLWLLFILVIAAVIYRYRAKFVALKTLILTFLKIK